MQYTVEKYVDRTPLISIRGQHQSFDAHPAVPVGALVFVRRLHPFLEKIYAIEIMDVLGGGQLRLHWSAGRWQPDGGPVHVQSASGFVYLACFAEQAQRQFASELVPRLFLPMNSSIWQESGSANDTTRYAFSPVLGDARRRRLIASRFTLQDARYPEERT